MDKKQLSHYMKTVFIRLCFNMILAALVTLYFSIRFRNYQFFILEAYIVGSFIGVYLNNGIRREVKRKIFSVYIAGFIFTFLLNIYGIRAFSKKTILDLWYSNNELFYVVSLLWISLFTITVLINMSVNYKKIEWLAKSISDSCNLIVQISGAVKLPGVYNFTSDQRINDAIEAAGGAIDGADINSLNLAAKLEDCMKINVPLVQKPDSDNSPD